MAKLISWIAQKAVLFVVIFAISLVVFAIYSLPGTVVGHMERELESAIVSLEEGKELVGEIAAEAEAIRARVEQRVATLHALNNRRKQLETWIARWTGIFNRHAREEEVASVAAEEAAVRNEIARLDAALDRLHSDHGLSESELLRRQILRDEKERQLSRAREIHEWLTAFMREHVGQIALQAALIVLALILLPLAWKVIAYWMLAPIAERAAPVDLLAAPASVALHPVCSENHPAQQIVLDSVHTLLTKPRYLQSSTDDSDKITQWILDLQFPFTSVAAGLFFLTRISPKAGPDNASCAVTLSCQSDATEELAVLDLPEGASLVFRPTALAALVIETEKYPQIRSRWVFNRLHAWLALHFRYLVITGPVRLVFAGQRGVQREEVNSVTAGRRINSGLTAAFSPTLAYKPRRAETFWAYFRGENALFDDFFAGDGITINQQVGSGTARGIQRFMDSIFGAIGKVFGL